MGVYIFLFVDFEAKARIWIDNCWLQKAMERSNQFLAEVLQNIFSHNNHCYDFVFFCCVLMLSPLIDLKL